MNQFFNFLLYSTQPTKRRASHASIYKSKSTGYETDKEDNDHDLNDNVTLAVPHSEIIFESDEFGTDDDEEPVGPSRKNEKEKKQVGLNTESDDDRSFIEEEIQKVG